MNHPAMMQANAKVRYDGMLEAAETYRRVKRLPRQDLGLRARIQSTLSGVLSARMESRTDAEMAVLNDQGVA